MNVLSLFYHHYQRGSPIPRTIWAHAEIVSDYLGYAPPGEWLAEFLYRPVEP